MPSPEFGETDDEAIRRRSLWERLVAWFNRDIDPSEGEEREHALRHLDNDIERERYRSMVTARRLTLDNYKRRCRSMSDMPDDGAT